MSRAQKEHNHSAAALAPVQTFKHTAAKLLLHDFSFVVGLEIS